MNPELEKIARELLIISDYLTNKKDIRKFNKEVTIDNIDNFLNEFEK